MNRSLIGIALIALLCLITTAGAGVNHFGQHVHLTSDTLGTDSTWYSDWLNTAEYPYLGVMVRTLNSVDSTKYNVYFVTAYDTTASDTFFIPCDTLGAADNTVFVITDSSSAYRTRSMLTPVGHFVKVMVVTDATDHGNRCAFWLETFLWKPLD